jgi:glycerol-1-phosphate dehydrogenase [NAD(P)+]
MDTKTLIIDEDAIDSVPVVFGEIWGKDSRPRLIADGNTWAVGGNRLMRAFSLAGFVPAEPFVFPSSEEVYADGDAVTQVRASLSAKGIVGVALGSGTINDIVKFASHECGKTYLVVPTAPSVDGYTSFGAAITVDGFKRTLPCSAPAAVVADTAILRKAPYPMIAAGDCDLMAKIPAGADWLIADALGVQPLVGEVWAMVQTDLRRQIGSPEAIAARDPAAIDRLFSGLAQVGFAMQLLKDTRPASGADHLFSHVWEMRHLRKDGVFVSHGFKVALGTLISTAMMTEMMKIEGEDLPDIYRRHQGKAWEERENDICSLLEGDLTLESALRVSREKYLGGAALDARRRLIAKVWDEVRGKVRGQILPFEAVRSMFKAAGAPVEPADIGLTKEAMKEGVYLAQMIRTRYTILDYLYEIGLYDVIAEKIMDGTSYFSEFA